MKGLQQLSQPTNIPSQGKESTPFTQCLEHVLVDTGWADGLEPSSRSQWAGPGKVPGMIACLQKAHINQRRPPSEAIAGLSSSKKVWMKQKEKPINSHFPGKWNLRTPQNMNPQGKGSLHISVCPPLWGRGRGHITMSFHMIKKILRK